jgi:hypothetical protein
MNNSDARPSAGRRRQLRVQRALEHAQHEVAGDKAGTLATLEADCWYEIHPAGLRMQGIDLARRYYDHYFEHVRPAFRETFDHGVWENEDGLAIEMTALLEVAPGACRTVRLFAVLVAGETGVVGERLWCDLEVARFFFGPVFSQFRPIPEYVDSTDPVDVES